MNRTPDRPSPADLDRLERAATAEPMDRVELGDALERIAAALLKHARDVDRAGGILGRKDGVARPSLARQADQLREDVNALATRAIALHDESRLDDDDPEPDIQYRALHLLAALQQMRDGEAGVVLESVTTDIGSGD